MLRPFATGAAARALPPRSRHDVHQPPGRRSARPQGVPMTMSRRTLLAGAAAGAVSPSLAQTQQDPTMADKRLSFSSGGRSITVDVFPAGRGVRRPAVIMLHGADGLSWNQQYPRGRPGDRGGRVPGIPRPLPRPHRGATRILRDGVPEFPDLDGDGQGRDRVRGRAAGRRPEPHRSGRDLARGGA